MVEIGKCGDSWLVVSVLGFAFFFYIFLICLFSPDRLHILHHKSEEEDSELYWQAWTAAGSAWFLYLLIAFILGFFKWNSPEEIQRWKEKFQIKKKENTNQRAYELNEFEQKNKILEDS